ncbi:MAG: RecX family transcriptional regulator [Emcibacter sp.]|nr:RecX family transcriptional regulator [Emcibacter sp.]
MTRDYLVRATYNYLQRFATTEKNLRDVLERKVRRRLLDAKADIWGLTEDAGGDTDVGTGRDIDEEDGSGQDSGELYIQAQGWIEEIVQKAVKQNLVNDRQFAAARAVSLVRGGNSKMMVVQKLQAKGVDSDVVAEVMQDLSDEHKDMDLSAAVKYVRKRRFGAFSSRHDGTEVVEKELASMCRAGFPYGLVNKILKMSKDELEEILFQIRF